MGLEKRTLEAMINIYCKGKHDRTDHNRTAGIKCCPICEEEALYALKRIDDCIFNKNKPVCSKCLVKCYNIQHKEMIQKVMRYSGPRMILYHPLLLIRYVFRKWIKKASESKL